MTETNGMQALAEYGYVMQNDGVLRSVDRPNSQAWQPVTGGFLRFDKGIPVPFMLKEQFRSRHNEEGQYIPGVSGLDFRRNPDCFEWVWPEVEIAKIYVVAKTEMDAYVQEKAKNATVVKQEEPVTEEQLEAMVAAQQPEPEIEEQPKKRWFGR